MWHSLRARLVTLLVLLVATAPATGLLMYGLFQQSATAQLGQAAAEVARGCESIAEAYRFYSSGASGASDPTGFRAGLPTVVRTALRNRSGVEGGIWDAHSQSVAYAYPTYEGAGPKTDVPQAESPRIAQINRRALAEDRPISSHFGSSAQSLLLSACPLQGPLPGMTAWAMTRVFPFAGRAYWQLMLGLALLLVATLAATVLVVRLQLTWSHHVTAIEKQLEEQHSEALSAVALTGERELDRVLIALNDAGARLAAARRRAEQLARQVSSAERLTAIGKTAAGVAHEIRNPLAAMRLKAENALASDNGEHATQALGMMLTQIDRLDHLLRRLLSVTDPETVARCSISIAPLIASCTAEHEERARQKHVRLQSNVTVEEAYADPEHLRAALDNLVANAIQAAPPQSTVSIGVHHQGNELVFCVSDQGTGPPPEIREELFEPFVTGRPEGTGLGLSMVRETAKAHGGAARYIRSDCETRFELAIPWQAS